MLVVIIYLYILIICVYKASPHMDMISKMGEMISHTIYNVLAI